MLNIRPNQYKTTFFISDLHLNHPNVIKYCNRPFVNVDDMNETLIKNWNNTIRNKDTVFFLGDLALGRAYEALQWLEQLNGDITVIEGNHDVARGRSKIPHAIKDLRISAGGANFFLVHNPINTSTNWNYWTIHGHHHNNEPEYHPFFDRKNKTFNVSVELTRYIPVPLCDILEIIKREDIKFMRDYNRLRL
jgi:calcineurin-like phosphoesterase family protein